MAAVWLGLCDGLCFGGYWVQIFCVRTGCWWTWRTTGWWSSCAPSGALANILATRDVYQWLLAEFPVLTVPAFLPEIAKHIVEHHIITVVGCC